MFLVLMGSSLFWKFVQPQRRSNQNVYNQTNHLNRQVNILGYMDFT